MRLVAIVPAAGSAERFGSAKLVADVGGLPLVARTVGALAAGGAEEVVLVHAPGDERLAAMPHVRAVVNEDPSRGMFSSIQAGMRASRADAYLVQPADMPFVRTETVRAIVAAYDGRSIVSPRHNGKRGHPIVLPGTLRDEILAAPPVLTLHDVIRAHADTRKDVEVDDAGILRDVDVPEDLLNGARSDPAEPDRTHGQA
ncbi:MAG TPA: nucleotidyltransferase family protein [Candidatus Limnocylindria bacterium]|nr:nucleotidyltransferase family protein [Candidatus Limnocylindria bacterium]